MSDLFVPICFCGSGLPGITFGFASVALALHKVGRSKPLGVAIRMEVCKAQWAIIRQAYSQKITYAHANIQLYHLKDLSFLDKQSIGF